LGPIVLRVVLQSWNLESDWNVGQPAVEQARSGDHPDHGKACK